MTESDESLVARMAAGDEVALLELHRRYAPYLTAMARRMLRDPDEVQACVQDTFVRAWDAAARFDVRRAAVKTWLVTIGHRLAINRLRGGTIETLPLETWDAPTQAHDPLERIVLQDALEQLPTEERELIELAFYEGHSHAQLSELTGKPLGSIKTKLRTALKTLRVLLEGGTA